MKKIGRKKKKKRSLRPSSGLVEASGKFKEKRGRQTKHDCLQTVRKASNRGFEQGKEAIVPLTKEPEGGGVWRGGGTHRPGLHFTRASNLASRE